MKCDNDVVFQAPGENFPYLYAEVGGMCATLFVDI